MLWSCGRRGPLRHSVQQRAPGMQAEDHLGRLPPSWLTLAGSLPAGSYRPAGNQLSSQGWLSRPGAPAAGSFAGWRGASRVPSPGHADPGGFPHVVAPQARRAGPSAFRRGGARQVLRRDRPGVGEQVTLEVTSAPNHVLTSAFAFPRCGSSGPAGEQIGIVAINDALRLAQEADLDLVEVAPTARPPGVQADGLRQVQVRVRAQGPGDRARTRRRRSSRRSSSGRRSTRTTTAPRRATSSGSSRPGTRSR